jgi:hypothetical protein
METVQLTAAYRALPASAQLEFLVRFAHELTLVGRDSYECGTLELLHPQRLRAVNEIQHRVSAHALALLTNDEHRYPDEVLTAIILEVDDPVLRQQVAHAFSRGLARIESNSAARH